MYKLKRSIRVQVARNTAREVWDMSALLEVIRQGVEVLEISEGVKTNVNLERVNPKPQRTHAQTSPFKGVHVKCAYCKGGQFSASCESVNDPKARFEILNGDGRCFVCLSLGHQSMSCEKSRRPVNGNHHQSFCRRQTLLKSQPDLSANKNSQGAQFYCKLLQQLQQMKIVQNLQELRSYLTMEVRDLM